MGLQLKNVERIFEELKKTPRDVILTANDAAEIWKIFRGSPIDPARVARFEYRAFLQAALMGAIDGSEAMGWVEALFKGAYRPTASVKSIIKSLVKHAFKKYYRHLSGSDPTIYQAVVKMIAYQCRPYFDMISNGLSI